MIICIIGMIIEHVYKTKIKKPELTEDLILDLTDGQFKTFRELR